MFAAKIFTLLACALSAFGAAVPEKATKGYHSLPLVKRAEGGPWSAGLYGAPFAVHFIVGSNQSTHFFAELDTGSYDLFVQNYDYNASTAYTNLNETFNSFLGAERHGIWVEDDLSIGEGPVVKTRFGVEDADTSFNSVFGAHFLGDEPNYIRVLKTDGYINKATFSIWYNRTAQEGQLLFGAYDAAKFQGPLHTTNLSTPDQGSWNINTTGIITPDGVTHYFGNQSTTLDTGNNNIDLPYDQLRELQASLPGSTWEGNYISYPSCNFTDEQTLGFGFGETVVEINLRDISYGYDGKCALLFQEGDPVYGAPFTSNAFTIFDIDDRTISVANRKQTNDVDIVVFD